jgi:hypothetical protein
MNSRFWQASESNLHVLDASALVHNGILLRRIIISFMIIIFINTARPVMLNSHGIIQFNSHLGAGSHLNLDLLWERIFAN